MTDQSGPDAYTRALQPRAMRPAPPVTMAQMPQLLAKLAARARNARNRTGAGLDTTFEAADVWLIEQALTIFEPMARALDRLDKENRALKERPAHGPELRAGAEGRDGGGRARSNRARKSGDAAETRKTGKRNGVGRKAARPA